MNTNHLKKMAADARQQLLSGIEARLHYVRSTDSAEIREQQRALQELERALAREGEAALIERVAYTWFNRLVALRFMDVNDYQPGGIRVLSPREGFTRPQLLEAARAGRIPEELPVDTALINDLLDGRRPSTNAENEVYRLLLMAACNQLHQTFPFLFEPLADYTELLLPEDVISPASILHLIREGLPAENCQEVEVLGWLYQFYIAEKKDAVFAKKGKVTAAEIPAATQLFTPRWIVEYMVQNTLGRLWLQSRPQSGLRAHLPYYLENPEATAATETLTVASPEEITLLDPACGSGHILIYAFELLTKIYEEEGYAPSEIAPLILRHNLYGMEIDQRAAQLATFALLMKARSYHRRALRKVSRPHIVQLQPIPGTEEQLSHTLEQAGLTPDEALLHDLQLMREADNYGSLILPTSTAAQRADFRQKVEAAISQQPLLSADLQAIAQALAQLNTLGQAYHCVVANPPYMGSGKMNKSLKTFVKKYYAESKADLMACFMESGLAMLQPQGLLGMINQQSWMFLSSYEKLREKLLADHRITSMLHLGPRTFPEIGGEVVQSTAFVFEKEGTPQEDPYLRLIDYKSSEEKRLKTLEAIQNPDCDWYYTARQRDFGKIPGSPVGYSLSNKFIKAFNYPKLNSYAKVVLGMNSTNNLRFTRFWFEVLNEEFDDSCSSHNKTIDGAKWYSYNKGGGYRKWYGNRLNVINWKNKGAEIHASNNIEFSHKGAPVRGKQYQFKESITWSFVTSGNFGVRYSPTGSMFDVAGSSIFIEKSSIYELTGFLNSTVTRAILKVLAPTLNFQVGNISSLPIVKIHDENLSSIAEKCIVISKYEWNKNEESWNFERNELIRLRDQSLKKAYYNFCSYWEINFFKLHSQEEELNRQFIEIYGLEEELTPDVPLVDITILQQELDQKKLNDLSADYQSGWQLKDGEWVLEQQRPYPELPFDQQEIMAQFVSYAVGCMFGRYSLDKEGLILANQGENLLDYVRRVSGAWWVVDGEGEWRLDPDKDVYAHYPDLERSEDTSDSAHHPPSTTHHPLSTTHHPPSTTHQPPVTFWPDEDNIIPVLDEEWFEDDIVSRFRAFLRASFGEEHFHDNLAFLEECLGTDIRSWFVKKFYPDHIKRYKKRPIYWLFSSPSGAFQALVYLHRYTPDTLNNLLNNYLRVYIDKLKLRLKELEQVEVDPRASAGEKSRARKQVDKYKSALDELETWEREVIYPLASERIAIDLDDGVLVNYNKFGQAVQEVSGLNDAKTKKKVRGFDWIDVSSIR